MPAPNNTPTTASIQCPVGTLVTGGGYVVSNPTATISTVFSRRIGNGWEVQVNIGGNGVTLSVYAECAS